jgi:anion-transporting  ArsA/GET3 family ATPase
VVTGKGGTGKTSVAAALALMLAAGGRRTLLVEVEGRQGIAQLFEKPPMPYEERRIASAPGGGEVRALAVDAEEALLEYLDLFYRLGAAGRALRKVGAIDFATTIAPGLRDVLLTGKVKEATTRSVDGRRVYAAVVLDAPPTGRIGRFLNVTAETARLAKVGPIKTQSEGVAALLRSPITAVHVVTLLEEMPVQETVDAIADLSALGIPVGKIIINATRPPLLAGEARVTQAELRRGYVRYRGRPSRYVRRTAYIGYALPGVVVALSLVFFAARYLPAVYQTIGLLIFAYVVRFLPEALGAIESALRQVNPRVEEAGRSLGYGPIAVLWRLTFPMARGGIASAAALVFLTTMKELPATLILGPIGFETLATRIWSATSEAFFARAAAPSLLLLGFSALSIVPILAANRD